LKAKEIRSSFLDFFARHQHQVVPSSTLVPRDDPTLLFTNAGMNQFKGVFLGLERRDYQRAVSVQKCMRVSGKHNDLEEVGKDARHHTFFEMLGNWSFGDYYKKESILWGWEFLTVNMGLAKDKLWVSVYKDDDESFSIWENEVGVPADRILRLGDLDQGDEENFWSMADTGPCGPCTEIHYDQGPDLKCDHADGCAVGVCDCDRWLELWNHVFMEFDRQPGGALEPLPMKSVDTGLGFERLVAVIQGKKSNYDTDLFVPLIEKMAEISRRRPEGEDRISMQVIADHARAVTFTITDGAIPANEGRGYVVRRILRRAARHGHLLGVEEPFLYKVAALVMDEMQEAYPELAERRDRVIEVIRQEEERFGRTLTAGLQVYGEFKAVMESEGRTRLTGEEAFKLHDTFGFPVDLTAIVAEEDGFTVDIDGFKVAMDKQRAQSRRENRFMAGISPWQPVDATREAAGFKSLFTGYENLSEDTEVVAVRSAGADDQERPLSHVLFVRTPFYAEAGGQVGDLGTIEAAGGETVLEVLGAVVSEEGSVAVVSGEADELAGLFRSDAKVQLQVDAAHRLGVMRNHTATHLLHAALRNELGGHVEQAGSVVAHDRLRFDFRHDKAVTAEELQRIEHQVNAGIMSNRAVLQHQDVPLDEAKERGAMALFGEKYGDRVRMIEIHDGYQMSPDSEEESGPVISLELCGGTHCLRTGDVGLFRILGEGSVAAGVRRIEAVTGEVALVSSVADRDQLRDIGALLRPDGGSLAHQTAGLISERDELRRELGKFQQDSARAALEGVLNSPRQVAGLKVVTALVTAEDKNGFMQLGDHVRDKLDADGVVVLATELQGQATLLVTVTADLVESKRLHAGNLVKEIAAAGGGRGGGRPNMAQAGMPDAAALEKALQAADEIIAGQAAG
jgi:alanyl-tRNA synthetase